MATKKSRSAAARAKAIAEGKYSIQQTKEMAGFIAALLVSIRQFKSRGIKFSLQALFANLQDFLPPILSAPQAFEGAAFIPKEFADLDDAEREEVKAIFADVLNLPDKTKEATIERLFNTGIDFFDAIMDAVNSDDDDEDQD